MTLGLLLVVFQRVFVLVQLQVLLHVVHLLPSKWKMLSIVFQLPTIKTLSYLHQMVRHVIVNIGEHLFPVGLLGFLGVGERFHDL